MKYSVKTFRAAGLKARWSRNRNGTPIIVVQDPQSKLAHQRASWWCVGQCMWDDMIKVGVVEGFDRHTLIGDIFSVTL